MRVDGLEGALHEVQAAFNLAEVGIFCRFAQNRASHSITARAILSQMESVGSDATDVSPANRPR